MAGLRFHPDYAMACGVVRYSSMFLFPPNTDRLVLESEETFNFRAIQILLTAKPGDTHSHFVHFPRSKLFGQVVENSPDPWPVLSKDLPPGNDERGGFPQEYFNLRVDVRGDGSGGLTRDVEIFGNRGLAIVERENGSVANKD